jgi:hypothetical protein
MRERGVGLQRRPGEQPMPASTIPAVVHEWLLVQSWYFRLALPWCGRGSEKAIEFLGKSGGHKAAASVAAGALFAQAGGG